ncbi:MAG TPA: hypothetical protein VF550_18240 [Polyangia bacterium]
MIGIRTPIALLAGFWLLVPAQAADAAEVTRVLSARGLKDFDVDVSLSWQHDSSKASIKREIVQPTGTLVANDVIHYQVRDSMQLRAEAGLVHDLSFFVAGSFVLGDQRGLDFDRSNCTTGNCVETLLRDGILPGTQGASWGLDAEKGGRPFQPPSGQLFRGPDRSGFEYLGLGLRWAAMNQARDQTKPTWTVGLETRLSVADDQRFDPGKPTANRSVGLGYHQILLTTLFSRRFGDYEPYMGGFFMQPALTSSSVYKNAGTGSFASPQRRTGGQLGIEGTLWEDPALQARFALETSARFEFRFEGLAQSELWEVLSGDPRCTTDASHCRSGIDVDSRLNVAPNSGIVHSPAYGLLGGDAGLSAHFGRHARLRSLFGMLFEESHFLTDADSGNRVYAIPGRRFRVEGQYAWHLLVDATATF